MSRVGLGVDVHAFSADRKLVLGGELIPDHPGLEGHSDADVVAHAVADAILGAAALGDIGEHFPDSDPQYRGADSLALLAKAASLVRGEGYEISNVDVTVMAETPKISPHRDSMRRNLAKALAVGAGQVSVKATTTERLGLVGRKEGIAAMAVALVFPAGEKA